MSLRDEQGSASSSASVLTAPFVVAVVVLGGAAILAGPVASRLDWRHDKKPLPLLSRLDDLNADALYPYVLRQAGKLEPAFVEALGTKDYIQWRLEDTSVRPDDPLRFADLFVTYYSGGGNLVPHTPDVCYLGNGYNPSQAHENMALRVPSVSSKTAKVPVRVCSFVKTAIFDSRETTVVYTFYCNGQFTGTRTGVRILLNDPSAAHAYFSKIEVSFPGADRASAVEGARRLFDKVLPLLIRDHFPDFEAAEAAGKQ